MVLNEFPLRGYFEPGSAYCLGAVLQSDLMAVWNLLDRILDWKDAQRKTLKDLKGPNWVCSYSSRLNSNIKLDMTFSLQKPAYLKSLEPKSPAANG